MVRRGSPVRVRKRAFARRLLARYPVVFAGARTRGVSRLAEVGDLAERLLLEPWDLGVVRRIPDRDEQERPFVLGPVEDLLQEAHRRRRVRERREPRAVQREQQEADRDADGLADVVVLPFLAVRVAAP